ncbi:MAG TPA: hypothetical protein DF712_08000 [Balneola sp.]|nr:hypothetical protein [Balneola sp.]
MNKKVEINSLAENDLFFLEGQRYSVLSNKKISSSFNEVVALCEGENVNLRIRSDHGVYVHKDSIKPNKPLNEVKNSVTKLRNDKGTVVRVHFDNITETKLTKDQIKKRDACAKELLGNDRFQDKYSNSDNIKAPGKNIDDVAYGTCTNRVKGVKNKTGKRSKKEETNESFDRLNTIKNILRRISQ